nr:hypothetical protein [Tanacetum cinerariifolium]
MGEVSQSAVGEFQEDLRAPLIDPNTSNSTEFWLIHWPKDQPKIKWIKGSFAKHEPALCLPCSRDSRDSPSLCWPRDIAALDVDSIIDKMREG